MDLQTSFGIIDLVLTFGIVMGFLGWQLYLVRETPEEKAKRIEEHRRDREAGY